MYGVVAELKGDLLMRIENLQNQNRKFIKSMDNLINISRKYSGIGNNAAKNSANTNNPAKNIGTFGNTGTFHIILCIYCSLNAIFNIVHPTVIPNPVI